MWKISFLVSFSQISPNMVSFITIHMESYIMQCLPHRLQAIHSGEVCKGGFQLFTRFILGVKLENLWKQKKKPKINSVWKGVKGSSPRPPYFFCWLHRGLVFFFLVFLFALLFDLPLFVLIPWMGKYPLSYELITSQNVNPYLGIPKGPKNTSQISIFIDDLSRNLVFFGTVGKPYPYPLYPPPLTLPLATGVADKALDPRDRSFWVCTRKSELTVPVYHHAVLGSYTCIIYR